MRAVAPGLMRVVWPPFLPLRANVDMNVGVTVNANADLEKAYEFQTLCFGLISRPLFSADSDLLFQKGQHASRLSQSPAASSNNDRYALYKHYSIPCDINKINAVNHFL